MEAFNQIVAGFQRLDAAAVGGFVGVALLILIFLMYRRMQRTAPVPVDTGVRSEDAPEPLFERSLTPAETQLESEPQPEPAPIATPVVEREAEPMAPAPRPAAELKGSIIEKVAQLNVQTPRAATQPSAPVASGSSAGVKDAVPQDSVLRRHYLAEQKARREAIANPYPTDSVLRRHYDALHRINVDSTARPVESAVVKTADAVVPKAAVDRVPEDAVLRRHFVANLRARIEAGLSPKPSDSVLRRHYEALVDAELHRQLQRFEA